MTNFFDFLKSWRIVWRHVVFLTSWQTFWHHDKHLAYFWWHFFTWLHLFDKPFEVMTNILSSWRVFTSWRIFWRQGELSDAMTYFWHYEIFFSVMTSALTSWRVYDIMTNFLCNQLFDVLTYAAPFDIMANVFTSCKVLKTWHTLDAMTHFLTLWRTSWCFLYVMIHFVCHWRHNIFLLHDNFWLHDKLLTS